MALCSALLSLIELQGTQRCLSNVVRDSRLRGLEELGGNDGLRTTALRSNTAGSLHAYSVFMDQWCSEQVLYPM